MKRSFTIQRDLGEWDDHESTPVVPDRLSKGLWKAHKTWDSNMLRLKRFNFHLRNCPNNGNCPGVGVLQKLNCSRKKGETCFLNKESVLLAYKMGDVKLWVAYFWNKLYSYGHFPKGDKGGGAMPNAHIQNGLPYVPLHCWMEGWEACLENIRQP